ncbi:hypothetical protein NBRC110019_15620 [Neptunitalea chrysea]|uniref:Uncharacterized protein YyaB-like PH domain-containing protein n=1 Tax=Neptunitalea chrysea TaxID=1647581 RepID=A0A9W6EVH5_9FLAO|nr:PH domain-containing protein [Neptunitalea chrysea]GLB52522.1 hypothetical protein NBRC110019_15620 [Neptunitalea chrysea]
MVSIPVGDIQKIIVGKTVWSGVKSALARGGLVLVYNKYSEIYVALINNEELIAGVKALNANNRNCTGLRC